MTIKCLCASNATHSLDPLNSFDPFFSLLSGFLSLDSGGLNGNKRGEIEGMEVETVHLRQ